LERSVNFAPMCAPARSVNSGTVVLKYQAQLCTLLEATKFAGSDGRSEA